jgi:RHS repeat-associated protein
MQASAQTTTQLLNFLTLLQTKQTLETLQSYKEFCYQLYLASLYNTIAEKTVGSHVEVVDETYSINKSNPHYKTTYNRYFHTDALGSITAITDDKGKVVERRSYEPFGKIRAMDYGLTNNHAIIPANTVSQTTRAFTGHEQIKEIDGLIHMNARIYDSDIGRFLSADTIIQDPLDSQAYNRYSYVRNNPMKFTDPSGHSWLSKLWKKAKKWAKKKWKKFIGGVLIVVGVVVAVGNPTLGASIAGAGVSLYNYDKTGKFEFQAPIIETGGGGNTEAEQVADLQEQSDAIDRAQSGTTPTSASPVTNDNFANGTATGSYDNMGGDTYTESNGEIILAPITVTPLPQSYAWIEDLPNYAYEVATYTNVGGVIDVGYQYYSGEIGGYYAAGLLGASALGGKAGGKAFSYGFSTSERLFTHFGKHGGDVMKGLNKNNYDIKNYLNDANYIIKTGQYIPKMNGYIKFMGKDGRANYGFVGMTRDGKNITTFGVRSVNRLKGF